MKLKHPSTLQISNLIPGRCLILINIQSPTPTTPLLIITRTKHITTRTRNRRLRQRRRTVTLRGVLDARVAAGRDVRLAERGAVLDGHVHGVRVRDAGQQTSVGCFGVATLVDVGICGLGRAGVDVGCVVEDAEAAGAAAGFGRVTCAGHRAAGLAERGGCGQGVGTVALRGVFDAGEGVVVLYAVGLAGLDGH